MDKSLKLKARARHYKNKSFAGKKLASKTYVSLFLVVLMLITSTYAWFTKIDSLNVSSGAFELESASTLNVSDNETLANHITISDVKLEEASSVDGRNVFFPTVGSASDAYTTDDLKFREATMGDENTRYIYKDFTLYGGSSTTYVYIKSYAITVTYASGVTVTNPSGSTVTEEVYNGSTEIKWSNGSPSNIVRLNKCPIRVAFISDSQEDPVVLDPSAMVGAYAQSFMAVNSTNNDGDAITNQSTAEAFSDYYHLTGKPVYTINGREPLNGTMVMWLEGASSRSDELRGATISVDIELESVFPKSHIIRFIDNTWGDDGGHSHWMNTKGDAIITMTYKDGTDHLGNDNIRTVVMKKGDGTITINDAYDNPACEWWWAPLPDSVVTDITFNRYDATDEMIFNAWYTCVGIDSATGFTEMYKPNNNNDMRNYDNGSRLRLEEYRTVDRTATGDLLYTYTALRGNGYGSTTNMANRLSPGVGYWCTDSHYYETSGSGSSSGGGGSSGGDTGGNTNYTIDIEMWNHGCDLTWMRNNLAGNYDMYVVFDDGTQSKMTFNNDSSNYRLTVSGTKPTSTQIKTFVLKNRLDGTTPGNITLRNGPISMIHSGNYNYTFAFMESDWHYIKCISTI